MPTKQVLIVQEGTFKILTAIDDYIILATRLEVVLSQPSWSSNLVGQMSVQFDWSAQGTTLSEYKSKLTRPAPNLR
jgi:hypothetical protein